MTHRKPYPDPLRRRGGCKVSWNYYATEAEAQACAAAARHNARIDAAAGYDFGYQTPGAICAPGQGDNRSAEYEVCLP